jgi:hypothetical protein
VGGGILNAGGTLDLSDILLTGNVASADNALGGAVFSTGTGASLSVARSRFCGNQAVGTALAAGGAIADDVGVVLTVRDSTFAGNVASGGGFLSIGGAVSNGVTNGGGTVSVAHSTFLDNQAIGGDGTADTGFLGGIAAGGAIVNDFLGSLALTGCSFGFNLAQAGAGAVPNVPGPVAAGFAFGGAIVAGDPFAPFPSTLTVRHCDFLGNQAVGGAGLAGEGGFGGGGDGGAIDAESSVPGSTLVIDQSSFTANAGVGGRGADGVGGGDGGEGGFGEGGAIRTSDTSATITASDFRGNSALSGNGGNGDGIGKGGEGGTAFGGTLEIDTSSILTISNSQICDSVAGGGNGGTGGPLGGDGGAGGMGVGGAIDSSPDPTVYADHLWVQHTAALGGAGGTAGGAGNGGAGGDALGGAIDLLFDTQSRNALLRNCTFWDNQAVGGEAGAALGTGTGGNGGTAQGGALDVGPLESVVVLDTLFANDVALGGNGGTGPTPGTKGQGLGGAIFNAGSLVLNRQTKFQHNFASTADDDISGPFSVI